MCLVIESLEPLIATEEIKVYKKCKLMPNNEIFSYFGWNNNNYRYGKIEEAVICPEPSINYPSLTAANYPDLSKKPLFVISEGLHGKLSLDHLKLDPNDNISFNGIRRVVVTEWIIPIGTKYYAGNPTYKNVASEKLIFSKFITEVEEDKILWRK